MVDEIFLKNNVPTKLNKLYKKRIRDFFTRMRYIN